MSFFPLLSLLLIQVRRAHLLSASKFSPTRCRHSAYSTVPCELKSALLKGARGRESSTKNISPSPAGAERVVTFFWGETLTKALL